MSKFKQIYDGVPITLKYKQALKAKGTHHYQACCDCGLVHSIVYIPMKTRLKIITWRDNRRTANHRRGKENKKK